MRVLVAFDKFKDALSAAEACGLAAAELRRRLPGAEIEECPLTDGGEGFASILTRIAGGKAVPARATGPRGGPVEAGFGLIPWSRVPPAARVRLGLPSEPDSVAVVEMAAASGLALLPPDGRDPWLACSTGTGELLRAAAERGCGGILLGIGGSATNDVGAGALQALGWRFAAAQGSDVRPAVPARWAEIARIEADKAPALPPLRIACDVSNPLLGPQGATSVYGPQKGLRPDDRDRLEAAVAGMAERILAAAGQPRSLMEEPGAGAAGGIGFGLRAAFGAKLVSGSALIADWLELERRVREADVVVTGEGRFDESSLSGKGPGAAIERAAAAGKPVHVLAGQVRMPPGRAPAGVELRAITPEGVPLPDAIRDCAAYLVLSLADVASKLGSPA